MSRKCPRGLNGTCSFCGWRLRSLSWEPGNEDGVPKVSTTAHVTEGALTLQAPRPRLSSFRKPLLATTKLPERTPLSESQSVSKALPWCSPSLGWPSLQLHLFVSEKAYYQEKWSITGALQVWNDTEVLRVMGSMFCQYLRKYRANGTSIDLSWGSDSLSVNTCWPNSSQIRNFCTALGTDP